MHVFLLGRTPGYFRYVLMDATHHVGRGVEGLMYLYVSIPHQWAILLPAYMLNRKTIYHVHFTEQC